MGNSPAPADATCSEAINRIMILVQRHPPGTATGADLTESVIIMCVCVCSDPGNRDSRRRAAGVCAGGAWQEQSSPGGTVDYHADRSTRGPKRPGRNEKNAEIRTMTQTNVSVRTGDKRPRLLTFTPVLPVSGRRAAFVSAETLCGSKCGQWILKGAQFAQTGCNQKEIIAEAPFSPSCFTEKLFPWQQTLEC